ncbi:MAG: DUF937 domain-containing protein [Verrucomicrobiaceae bacterium]|nr:DUF937 domain-containing protein [Verrucomicrobiaceae bacterium]
MGLLDSLAKNVLGGMLGGNSGGQQQDPAAMLSGLLNQSGGLQGLMGQFQKAGLGDQFSSWVGTGENQPVNADQVQNALGGDAIQGLASKLGLNAGSLTPLLAQFLPLVIDKLTPKGQIEQNEPGADQLQNVLGSVMKDGGGLGGLLGGLLGGAK